MEHLYYSRIKKRLEKLTELVKKISLQEVQQSDTRTDGDGNMLINNGYRSQRALDDSSILPDKLNQHGDTIMYEELGRGQRTKKMTKKGLEYQISLMKEKRQKMYSLLLRKCIMVEDFFFLSRNMIAVDEEMSQLKDMFQLLMSLHR